MTHRTKIILEWIVFSLLGLILVLSTSIFFYQRAYAGEIYPNVHIGQIDMSGKSKNQAKYLLNNKLENILQKEVSFTASESQITVPVSDTGLGIDVNTSVNKAYAVGRDLNFLRQLYLSVKTLFFDHQINIETQIDNQKFDAFIAQKIPELNQEPKNAELVIESGKVVETSESSGISVDTNYLEDQVTSLITQDDVEQELVIELQSQTVEPEIKLADIQDAKANARKIISKNISFTYEGSKYTPTKSDIGNWIYFSISEGKYISGLSDAAVKTYLTKIARNFEIQKIDRKINALNNEVIEEGREGKYLDKNRALSLVKSQIYSKDSFSVILTTYIEAPQEIKVFPAEGIVPGRFEGKYIDIDLGQQKLCIIETNNILGCYTVSTGKPSMPTPTGTRFIQSKNPRAWSAKYGLYMPWWMNIGGSYGIHELPEWPGGYKEGADHLGIPVSHGCVRLGVGPAQTVYNWVDIGTPVYIHK